MKKIIGALLLLPITLLGETKIGYIDSQRILSEYKGREEIQNKLQAQLNQWESEAIKKKKEIQSLVNELNSQGPMLSERAKERKKEEVDRKQKEYQDFVQEIYGQGGKAEQKNREIMQPFINKVNVILVGIGKDEGYTMIFDIANSGVVYAMDGLDLTDRVVAELNKEFGPTTTKKEEEKKIYFYVFKFKETDIGAQESMLGSKMQSLLKAALIGMENIEVVRSTKLSNAFSLAKIEKSEDKLTQEEAIKIGEYSEADFVLTGEVSKIGDVVTAKCNVINIKDSQVVKVANGRTGDVEKIEEMVGEMAQQIIPEIKP